MGAVGQAIYKSTDKIIPTIPMETGQYNKAFIGILTAIGLYSTLQLTSYGIKNIHSKINQKPLSKDEFQKRYGEGSWAIVIYPSTSSQYCIYLAKMGLNLILMGDQEDMNILRSMLDFEAPYCSTIMIPMDLRTIYTSYGDLLAGIKQYDISFLVLPKLVSVINDQQSNPQSNSSHLNLIPAFQNYYFILRFLGPLLRQRKSDHRSAIILPSSPNIGLIQKGYGTTRGLATGIDALVRSVSYENRDKIDGICNRGSTQSCFVNLGKTNISY